MPSILPVSSLRSYTEVLDDVGPGSPVFLTKKRTRENAILEMEDYDRLSAEDKLFSELEAGRISGEEGGWITGEQDGWITSEEVRDLFARKADNVG